MERIPGNTCIFITNNDGRIISLSLENCWGTDNKGYVLPAIISSLEKMTELRLGLCRSLPLELSNMPQLKTLRFFDSRILLSDFPGQLKQLGSKPSPFLTWITKQLPNLEGLGFKSLKRNELEFIIDSLSAISTMCAFKIVSNISGWKIAIWTEKCFRPSSSKSDQNFLTCPALIYVTT